MARTLTWAEFLVELKTEAGIQTTDVREDALLLALANESLTQIVAAGKDLRDFRIDELFSITSIEEFTITSIFIADIDQMYYVQWDVDDDSFLFRWDLTEQSGIVGPPPVEGYPNSYTIWTRDNVDLNLLDTTIKLYPHRSARTGDKVQIIGNGFRYIIDGTTPMPYFSQYPVLKLAIMERYAIKRNLNPNNIQLISGLLTRAQGVSNRGTADNSNTETNPVK